LSCSQSGKRVYRYQHQNRYQTQKDTSFVFKSDYSTSDSITYDVYWDSTDFDWYMPDDYFTLTNTDTSFILDIDRLFVPIQIPYNLKLGECASNIYYDLCLSEIKYDVIIGDITFNRLQIFDIQSLDSTIINISDTKLIFNPDHDLIIYFENSFYYLQTHIEK